MCIDASKQILLSSIYYLEGFKAIKDFTTSVFPEMHNSMEFGVDFGIIFYLDLLS